MTTPTIEGTEAFNNLNVFTGFVCALLFFVLPFYYQMQYYVQLSMFINFSLMHLYCS